MRVCVHRGCELLRKEFGIVASEERPVTGQSADPDAKAASGDVDSEAGGTGPDAWPNDGWTPPCAGYMARSLCKGRSGRAGRWGKLADIHPSMIRFPLMVCTACGERHGLGSGTAGTSDHVWADGVVRLARRPGFRPTGIVQMVHLALGEIGH